MSNYKISIEMSSAGRKIPTRRIKQWAHRVLSTEGIERAAINIVLVDDAYMTHLNHQYLQHDEPTDVLSFNLSDDASDHLEGEIYADVDQIARQAQEYGVSFDEELARIVVHGMLHLMGYDDQSDQDRRKMTNKEDDYLNLFMN